MKPQLKKKKLVLYIIFSLFAFVPMAYLVLNLLMFNITFNYSSNQHYLDKAFKNQETYGLVSPSPQLSSMSIYKPISQPANDDWLKGYQTFGIYDNQNLTSNGYISSAQLFESSTITDLPLCEGIYPAFYSQVLISKNLSKMRVNQYIYLEIFGNVQELKIVGIADIEFDSIITLDGFYQGAISSGISQYVPNNFHNTLIFKLGILKDRYPDASIYQNSAYTPLSEITLSPNQVIATYNDLGTSSLSKDQYTSFRINNNYYDVAGLIDSSCSQLLLEIDPQGYINYNFIVVSDQLFDEYLKDYYQPTSFLIPVDSTNKEILLDFIQSDEYFVDFANTSYTNTVDSLKSNYSISVMIYPLILFIITFIALPFSFNLKKKLPNQIANLAFNIAPNLIIWSIITPIAINTVFKSLYEGVTINQLFHTIIILIFIPIFLTIAYFISQTIIIISSHYQTLENK